MGDGATEREGMLQPVVHYSPSLAPSGMAFYTGDAFPEWRGSLFLGALARRHLRRVELRNGQVIHQEELLADREWRVHLVRSGPDGALYLGVAGSGLVRLTPVSPASLRSAARGRMF